MHWESELAPEQVGTQWKKDPVTVQRAEQLMGRQSDENIKRFYSRYKDNAKIKVEGEYQEGGGLKDFN